jgi:hypothetical protein
LNVTGRMTGLRFGKAAMRCGAIDETVWTD